MNGLVPDRYPTPSYASIAAVGFALTAYPIGAERGYVSRAAGAASARSPPCASSAMPAGAAGARQDRLQGILLSLPRHEDRRARRRQRDLDRGHRAPAGRRHALRRSYFDPRDPDEVEIRKPSTRSTGASTGHGRSRAARAISIGWSPEKGFIAYDWRGYNEAMLVVPARARLAHPPGRAGGLERVDGELPRSLGHASRAGVPRASRRCSATSTRTCGSTSAASGCLHARAWHRLLREHAPRGLRAATPTRSRIRSAGRPTARTSGASRACDGPGPRESDLGKQERPTCATPRAVSACGRMSMTAPSRRPPPSVRCRSRPRSCMPATLEMYHRFGASIYSSYGFLDAFNVSYRSTSDEQPGARGSGG